MPKLRKTLVSEIIRRLEAGEDLPLDLKHELFPPEKQEYELVYAGKQRVEDILAETLGVPLQAIRTFGQESGQPKLDEWTNRLIFGDNLQAMKALIDDPDVKGKVQLVYIDPPFATKRDFTGSRDQRAYQDKIAGAQFIEFLRKRLVLIHALLSATGVLLVHLDQKKSHYMKVVLDEIFGEHNFRNEIIWRNTNAHNKAKTFGEIHQSILMYSRTTDFKFKKQKRPRFKKYEEQHYRHSDEVNDYTLADLTGEGRRTGESGQTWLGYNPTAKGRHWAVPSFVYELVNDNILGLPLLEKLNYLLDVGLIVRPNHDGSQPRVKKHKGEDDGIFIQDIWTYQPYTQGIYTDTNECIDQDVSWAINKQERTNYPTQKPEGLLSRIIRSCTEDRDLVVDVFAGSGTTLAVAEKLGRRWIGIDCGKLAIYSIQKRMLNLRSEIGNKGNPLKCKPFTLYNSGLYDFQRMIKLAWAEYRKFAIQLFGIVDDPHKVAGVKVDGRRGTSDCLIFNFQEEGRENVVVDELYIDELARHLGDKAGEEFYIVAPASRVTFLQDYMDKGDTKFYILRIPYSIIDELHRRGLGEEGYYRFKQLQQPGSEEDVNNTIDAIGFDFIQPPEVECEYSVKMKEGEVFHYAAIKIKSFNTEALLRETKEFEANEALSMVMVDYDYKNGATANGTDLFELDAVFFAAELKEQDWEIRLNVDHIGQKIMLIYIDVFGNELREVKTREDFGINQELTEIIEVGIIPSTTGSTDKRTRKRKNNA